MSTAVDCWLPLVLLPYSAASSCLPSQKEEKKRLKLTARVTARASLRRANSRSSSSLRIGIADPKMTYGFLSRPVNLHKVAYCVTSARHTFNCSNRAYHERAGEKVSESKQDMKCIFVSSNLLSLKVLLPFDHTKLAS